MKQIELRTTARRQMVDVTSRVQQELSAADVTEGVCTVFVPHTTAAVVINENADPDVVRDLLAAYEALVPEVRFAHAEGNSDAHLLSSVIGPSVSVLVEQGRLRLGTWQSIFFVELDGPRTRKLWVAIS
jgi:secondary thiamine-phosphate synthase enzyme